MTALEYPRDRGVYQMREALEINFALWGMIFCVAVKTAQLLQIF